MTLKSGSIKWVEFEITSICNAPLLEGGFVNDKGVPYSSACKYCYQRDNQCHGLKEMTARSAEMLSTGRLLEVTEEIAGLGIQRAYVLGGEPFLRPDMVQLLNEMCRKIDYVRCATNAFNILRIVDQIQDIHAIELSIDHYVHEIAYKTRPRPIVDKAIEAISVLPWHGLYTMVNCVITQHNYARVIEYIDYCFDRGVRAVNLYPLMSHVDNSLVIAKSRLEELFGEISVRYDIEMQTYCKGGKHVYVEGEGNVTPCAGFIGKGMGRLGNLKVDSLKSILSCADFKKLQKCDYRENVNTLDKYTDEDSCLAVKYWEKGFEDCGTGNEQKEKPDAKYCLRCNKKLTSDAKKCSRCGFEKFDQVPIQMACHEITVYPR